MKASYQRHLLKFKRPSGTSRGVLNDRETWLLFLNDGEKTGVGECGLFRGLSSDDCPDFENRLQSFCEQINDQQTIPAEVLKSWPSIRMGYEMALLSLQSEEPYSLFPSDFTRGFSSIPINGLVWMGDISFMREQIEQKIAQGFDCIKLKIGALEFAQELSLLTEVRKSFDADQLILRVDANGAFTPAQARERLQALADLDIHSIEQPIAAGQTTAMGFLCRDTPLPIALDEELIGIAETQDMAALLDAIAPQYIILKPSLLGGFKASEQWIELANQRQIGWWVTSALESNIGLNAIAQWTYSLQSKGHQGLGTGSLFLNNFTAPLEVRNGYLTFDPEQKWDLLYL